VSRTTEFLITTLAIVVGLAIGKGLSMMLQSAGVAIAAGNPATGA
jgi:hypothetical protein